MQRRSHLSLFFQGERLDWELAGLNECAIRQGRWHIVTLRLSDIVHPGGLGIDTVQACCVQRDGICDVNNDLYTLRIPTAWQGSAPTLLVGMPPAALHV
jgi:hypothetical protein